MYDYTSPTQFYREAVQHFPFPDLQRSGGVAGSLSDTSEDSLYCEEFSFVAGHLIGYPVQASGCIEYSKYGERVKIVALFWLTVNVGWFTKNKLGTSHIWGEYHIQRKTWNLVVNSVNK